MREKVMRGSRNSIRRCVAWLLIFTTLFTCANPTDFAYSAEEKNWEVEYSLETDEGIPLATDGNSIQLAITESESVAIGMMLAEGKRKNTRRFGENFHIYMPEKLYDLITVNGENPIEGLLESELAKEGYLLEVTDVYAGEATHSNASESNATGSNATGSDATGEEGVYKLTFRFAEDLRKADDPKALEVEDTEGKLFFTAPENTLLTLTQEGNDCRITMEDLVGVNRIAPLSTSLSGMNISMELYQNSVLEETGTVIWNPSNHSSTTHITTRIYFAESASKGYEAGEITITVHGTLLDSLSEYWRTSSTDYNPEYNVSAEIWDYDYDDTLQAFVFTNAAAIAAGSSGYFEITWGATGKLMAGEYEFYAELEVDETSQTTDTCKFGVVKDGGNRGSYSKTAFNAQSDEVVAMYSRLPENKGDYYWVGYDLYRYINQTSYDTMMMDYVLTDAFPEGSVVLNSSGTVIRLNADSEYVISSGRLNSTSNSTTTRIYVGYPKVLYEEDAIPIITNTFDVAVRYEDEEERTTYSATCQVALVEFDFSYNGDQYGITKTGSPSSRRLPMFKIEGNVTNSYSIYPVIGNPLNVPKDIIIGDDILYISREDGLTTRLEEDEYRFNSVRIPSFSAKTGETYAGYPYTLEVLERGEDDYTTYRTGTLPTSTTTISLTSMNVVAWRVTLKGIDGPIDNGYLYAPVDVFASEVFTTATNDGKLHNFCYLQVKDQNGNVLNEPGIDSYSTVATQYEIASFDQEKYGSYMQRDVYSMDIAPATDLQVSIYKSEESAAVYEEESKVYNVTYRLDSAIGDIEYMLLEDTYMNSITMYDIFPEGVYLDPQKITMDYLSGYTPSSSGGTILESAITSALLKSGAKLNSRAEINDYLQQRTIIKITEDYRGSGRTKVTATLDFSDDPLNLEDLQKQLYSNSTRWYILFMRVSIPTMIPNSVVYENKGQISNYAFIEADLELPDEDTFTYMNSQSDNGNYGGIITRDINENDDTTDRLGRNVVTTSILPAGSAYYATQKLVRTSSTLGQFVDTSSGAASSELDKVYTYLLRVFPEVSAEGLRMGNLIVYDTIEGVSGVDGWQGLLQGVDLNAAVELGIDAKVYYLTATEFEELSDASIFTEVWKEYQDGENLPKGVTIAFDLRYDMAGGIFILPESTALDLNVSMKAPSTYDDLGNAKNSFSVKGELFDPVGNSTGTSKELLSKEVEVELKNVIIPSATLTLEKVDEVGDPILSDTAKFELFYDVTKNNPVTYADGSSVSLATNETDGSATVSFTLDPNWKRYDDTYRIYLTETKVPDGYYYPGGSLDNPYMNYMVELTFEKADESGNYKVSPTSKNADIYTISVADNTQVTLTIVDKKVKVSETLAVTKTYTNGSLTGNDFTFKLKLTKSPEGSTVLANGTEMTMDEGGTPGRELLVMNNPRGTAAFPDLVFDTIGTYEFELWEVKDASKDYIGYDSDVRTITIAVGKESPDDILYVTEVQNEEKDFSFTNTYTPDPIDRSLELAKILLYTDASKYEGKIPEFTFVMESVGSYGENVTMPTNRTAVSTEEGNIRFEEITFKRAGTYVFAISEQNNTVPGITFDPTVIHATVIVEDDGAGTLSVKDNTITYTDSTNNALKVDAFKNILSSVTTRSGKGRFTAVKNYLNWDDSVHTMTAGEFEFLAALLEQADDSTVKQGETELVLNQKFKLGTNQADGEAVFQDLTFDKAGTYVFAITEDSDASKGYIDYSSSVYYAKVVAAIPDDGKVLEANVTYYADADLEEELEAKDIVFTNVYEPLSTTHVLTANKELFNADGTRVISEIPAYTFKLELDETSDPDAAIVMPGTTTVQNNGAGEIRFDAITFTIKGTYRFTIKETGEEGTGTNYDKAAITVEIPVIDVDGQLTVDADNITYSKSAKTGEEEDNTFVNKIAPVSIDLEVTKTLTGRALKDQEFSFKSEMIYVSNGVSLDDRTAKNGSTGEVRFPSYTFTEAGTYVFKISEVQGSDSSINYTNAVCYAKVTVTKNQNGELVAGWYYGTGYNTSTQELNGQLKEGEVPAFENTIRGYLTIKKVSSSAATPLSGAQFELSYREAGSSDDWTVYGGTLETAGSDGVISLELPDEYWKYEYQLIETKAPTGYSRSRVGTILFTMGQNGVIASWSSSGTQGYVEVSADRTAIIAKNHTTGGGGGGGGGGTTPTQPATEAPTEPSTEGTAPTVPESPSTPGDNGQIEVPGDPPSVIVEDPNGNTIYEGPTDNGYLDTSGWAPGTYTIYLLDEEEVPLGQMLVTIAGNETPLAELAKTGDTSLPGALLIAIMLGAVGSMTALVLKRRKEEE